MAKLPDVTVPIRTTPARVRTVDLLCLKLKKRVPDSDSSDEEISEKGTLSQQNTALHFYKKHFERKK